MTHRQFAALVLLIFTSFSAFAGDDYDCSNWTEVLDSKIEYSCRLATVKTGVVLQEWSNACVRKSPGGGFDVRAYAIVDNEGKVVMVGHNGRITDLLVSSDTNMIGYRAVTFHFAHLLEAIDQFQNNLVYVSSGLLTSRSGRHPSYAMAVDPEMKKLQKIQGQDGDVDLVDAGHDLQLHCSFKF